MRRSMDGSRCKYWETQLVPALYYYYYGNCQQLMHVSSQNANR